MSNADDSLPERALAGDRSAWQQLFQLWTPRMLRMLRSLSVSDADAEEIAQETWVRVWKNRDRFDPARPFGPFLYTIAKHLWADRLRSQLVRQQKDECNRLDAREPCACEPDFDQWEIAHEYVQRIDHCLDALTPQERRMIALRYHNDWTNRQIAEVLEDTESQVKHRVWKVVHRLRDCVGADPALQADDIMDKIWWLFTTMESETAANPMV